MCELHPLLVQLFSEVKLNVYWIVVSVHTFLEKAYVEHVALHIVVLRDGVKECHYIIIPASTKHTTYTPLTA